MAKPAARITDPTSCPMPGHGPKAIASGSPDVFFDGLAAARKGDACTCGSALASAVSGTVFIDCKNGALIDTVSTHGDTVFGGSGAVIIGDSHTPDLYPKLQNVLSEQACNSSLFPINLTTRQPIQNGLCCLDHRDI
jgi:uncharacterized Zn-binding protein involved in type VI secretion